MKEARARIKINKLLEAEGESQAIYVWTHEAIQNTQISTFTEKNGKKQYWFDSRVWTKDTAASSA